MQYKNLNYRLGLDLGVSSIGSAIVKIDDEGDPLKIVDAGVRIFPVSEGASDRREKRTARKNNVRTKKRLKDLGFALFELGLWDYAGDNISTGLRKTRATDVYKLRNMAVTRQIKNPYYIGRIFMHLAKHRGAGYISAQQDTEQKQAKNKDNNKKQKVDPYTVLPKILKENPKYQTIGQYFYARLQDPGDTEKLTLRAIGQYNPNTQKKMSQSAPYETRSQDLNTHKHIRNKDTGKGFTNKSTVDYAIPRYLVKAEFNKIWDIQADFYEQMQDPTLKRKIYDIIFNERPHMPYAIGKCIFIDSEYCLPKAHPLSEYRRIYGAVHNIRIEKEPLNIKQIKKIVCHLKQGTTATENRIKKWLQLNSDIIIAMPDKKEGITPYIYATKDFKNMDFFTKLLQNESKLTEVIEFIFNPVDKDDTENRLCTEDKVIAWLQKKCDESDEQKISKMLMALPKGRANLGKTATKQILQGFKQSKTATSERTITDKLAQTNPQFKSVDDKLKDKGDLKELPYYGAILTTDTQPIADWLADRQKNTLNEDEKNYGKVPNPAVHMMLNQLRRVVNEIIRIYGKPVAIHIEMARDVGMSAKDRDKHIKKQNDNTDKNATVKKQLGKLGHPITPQNILKYKLAKEQKFMDIFNYPNNISCANLTHYEVEHLIPRSKGGTDNIANRCLMNRNDNNNKKNMYPYDYLSAFHPDALKQILKFINETEEMKYKAWRFEPDAQEKFELGGDMDATHRYITDTRYFVKLASRYVKPIMQNPDTPIVAIKGQHTALLRQVWNLLGIEYDLRGDWAKKYPRYIDRDTPIWICQLTGEVSNEQPDEQNWKRVDKKKNPDWLPKPRFDHRHHALDAIVVALASESIQQKMAKDDKRQKYYWVHQQTGEIFYTKPQDHEKDNYIPHKRISFPAPLPNFGEDKVKFRATVVNVLQKIKVSHKPDHGKQGKLHKDTGKIIREDLGGNQILTEQRKPVNKIFKIEKGDAISEIKNTKDIIEDDFTIYDGNTIKKIKIKSLVKPFVASQGAFIAQSTHTIMCQHTDLKDDIISTQQDYESIQHAIKKGLQKAYQELQEEYENEDKENGKISASMVLNRAIKLAYTDNSKRNKPLSHKISEFEKLTNPVIIPKHGGKNGLAYEGGNNHCIDIYHDIKGKIKGEVIKLFDACNREFKSNWQNGGGKLLYKLYIDDILEMDTPKEFTHLIDDEKCFVKITSLESPQRIWVCLINDAGNKILAKSQFYMKRYIWRKSVSTYVKHNARKVELTPFGKIHRKHKVMADISDKPKGKTHIPKPQKQETVKLQKSTKQQNTQLLKQESLF